MRKVFTSFRKKWATARAGGLVCLPWNLVVLFIILVYSRLFPQGEKAWPLFVKVLNSYGMLWVGNGSDVTVFREVFADQCYELSLVESPRVIIDVGANVGYTTVWFALRYPQAHIWGYEPDTANLARLQRNVKGRNRITICAEALSGNTGLRMLHSASGQGMSSSLYPRSGLKSTEVSTVTFDEALARAGGQADVVKFDIEGAEDEVFRASKNISGVHMFIGEVHPDLLPFSRDEFEQIFQGYALTRIPTERGRYILRAQR